VVHFLVHKGRIKRRPFLGGAESAALVDSAEVIDLQKALIDLTCLQCVEEQKWGFVRVWGPHLLHHSSSPFPSGIRVELGFFFLSLSAHLSLAVDLCVVCFVLMLVLGELPQNPSPLGEEAE
jgi:hypothetical protein